MPKYRCSKTKDEILDLVVEHFNIANKECEENPDDMRFGGYSALWHLMRELEVFDDTGE